MKMVRLIVSMSTINTAETLPLLRELLNYFGEGVYFRISNGL